MKGAARRGTGRAMRTYVYVVGGLVVCVGMCMS
jgi:hypothetical protein